jgi:uncharacterized protein (TIGR02147 family)
MKPSATSDRPVATSSRGSIAGGDQNENSLVAADIRLRLQKELVRRCQTNSKYSLRAFARFLGIENSRLSKILRGERPVGPKLLEQIARKLAFSPLEVSAYQDDHRKKKGLRFAAAASKRAYLALAQDSFELIEDSRHYLLLELMKTNDFTADPKWFARVMGVSTSEIQAYLDRLIRVGLLDIRGDGTWIDLSEGFSSHILDDLTTTAAHQRSQIQILRLAIEAIQNVSMEKRDQSSMMMATHSSKVIEAKKRIRAFRRELNEFLEDCTEKDAVYQLSVSLFPLTPTDPEEPKR